MDSTLSMAPRLQTSAAAAAAVSATSRGSEAMVGEPPTASRTLAQSFTVTIFVMQSTSGARCRTRVRAEAKFMGRYPFRGRIRSKSIQQLLFQRAVDFEDIGENDFGTSAGNGQDFAGMPDDICRHPVVNADGLIKFVGVGG